MKLLKQSTAATIVIGPFLDDTDGKTAETALTISQGDVLLHKHDGTSISAKNDATSATHRSSGYYTVPLDSTDTNTLGRLRVLVSESGALPVWDDFMVVPANVYDSLVLGTDTLQVDVTSMATNTLTASALATDAVNEIVDQVWDETAADHAGAGSTGAALSAATAPTAAAVADAVWDEAIAGHVGAGSTGAALNSLALSGANQVTVQVNDPSAVALPNVVVDVYGSSNTVFLSRSTTNASGQVTFALDDGTYHLRMQKAGYTFTVPETLTVTVTETQTFSAAATTSTTTTADPTETTVELT